MDGLRSKHMQSWIPVSERKPTCDESVLCAWPDGRVDKGWHDELTDLWFAGGTLQEPPFLWMPMPSVPAPLDAFEEWYKSLSPEDFNSLKALAKMAWTEGQRDLLE